MYIQSKAPQSRFLSVSIGHLATLATVLVNFWRQIQAGFGEQVNLGEYGF